MELFTHIFGEHSISFYIAAVFFILLGQTTNKIISFGRRPVDVRFDLLYWIKDNWLDTVFTLIIAFVAIRFTTDIINTLTKFTAVDLGFVTDKMYYYFGLGLGFQTLMQLLRKRLKFLRLSKLSDGTLRPKGTPLSGK